jgi:putative flippase GtrA
MQQISKFGLVGILNTLIGYVSYLVLLDYTNYLLSLVVAHIIGVLHSYIWNRYWIFKSNNLKLMEFIRFNSVYAVVLVTNMAILFLFVDIFDWDPRTGQIAAIPLITMISFAGHKLWSFRKD